MTLWLDADATPRDVKDVCLRAAERLHLETILVANQRVVVAPGYTYVRTVRVDGGPDVADRYGVETGGHAAYGPGDKQAFANALDRALTRATRKRGPPTPRPIP